MHDRRRTPLVLAGLLALLVPLVGGKGATAGAGASTDRSYEILRNGQKHGHSRVVWAPSTWEKRTTVHDTTTIVQKSVRSMMGIKDVFETVTTVDLERDDDGTLWWMKIIVEEAGRVTVIETTWTGEGYEHVTRLDDQEQRITIPLDQPVMTDSEAFLGSRVRSGTLKVGDRFDLRLLDVTARDAHVSVLEVVGREDVVDGAATADAEEAPVRIPCFVVKETDPQSGGTTRMWIDDDGAFVRLLVEGGTVYRRVPRAQAESTPVRAAEFSVTTPSTPVLERIMNADHLWLDLHLQGDPDRSLPVFPDSPWSRVLGVEGNDEEGWVVRFELDRHDDPEATATLPLATEGLERHLESTVLMPCHHERIQEVVRNVIGEEKDARKAAVLLARWVFETLDKQSPNVAQAGALEILESSRGDCSEHALLFVTLCRAAGIPTRTCSGYVNVAGAWGAHAWAEVWLGRWIGADPTTGEVGTAARYVFFGYHDDPESHPGLVSGRARGRMRFVATRIAEGEQDWDLTDPARWHLHDRDNEYCAHVLAGIETRNVPRDWVVRMMGTSQCRVRAEGFSVEVRASADQGMTLDQWGGATGTFAGAPARRIELPGRGVAFLVHSRRRVIQVLLRSESPDEVLPRVEEVFAATFAPRAMAPPDPKEPEEGPVDEPAPEDGDE